MAGPSDAQVIRRVLAGDREMYAQLVDRYRDCLGRYALRMLGERADAEDAVQETFVRAYRSLRRCEPDNFGAWVYGILVNRCRTNGSLALGASWVVPSGTRVERTEFWSVGVVVVPGVTN